jgi:secreted trypsin-like serine protease
MHNRKQSLAAGLISTLIALVLGAVPAAAITWGQPDTAHPNVGSIVLHFGGFESYQWCSGTLIHPRIFLTAGHCTVDLDQYLIQNVQVNFDQNAFNVATLKPVQEVITHPNYHWGPTSNPYDVGILVLADPVTDIAPANLPAENLLDALRAAGELRDGAAAAKFTLVGYGNWIRFPPPEFGFFGRRESSISEYRGLLHSWLHMSQNQATGDGGTCYGDSGGPAFWTGTDGREILVGVTSWGDIPCVASSFNYRIDTADSLDFIHDVIEWLEPTP